MAEINDEALIALSAAERSQVMARLQELAAAEYRPSRSLQVARRWFLRLLALGCLLLVPWIVALAVRLPRQYVASQWRLTWIGFDTALLVALAWAAWTLWRQQPVAISATMVAATLLCCDAWFDVTTSVGGMDFVVSATTALLIEIPLAATLIFVSFRVRRVRIDLLRGIVPALRKQE